jgi:general secretion pathway protein D
VSKQDEYAIVIFMPVHRFIYPLVVGAAVLAGCAPQARPVPIAVPQPSPLAQQAGAVGDVRSTIIGGEAPVPSAPQISSATPRAGDIAFNFPGADVAIVAKAVLGDVLRKGYTIAPGVTTPVTFVTPGKVAREAVLGLFETALKNAGLALTPVASGYLIQPVASAQAPVAPDALGYGNEILPLQFINADELKKLLDSVLPGVVTATDVTRNSITVAGTTGQRQSARDLTKQFDVNWLRNMSFALIVPQRTDSRLIVPELDKLINAPDAPTRGLVKLIQMERLNGILAISAQRQYLEDVRRWIDVLDREGENNEAKLFVYRVQNGRARDLAKTLNGAFGGGSGGDAGEPIDPLAAQNDLNTTQNAPRPIVAPSGASQSASTARDGGASAGSGTNQPVNSFTGRISADEVNNAVIVFGTPRDYAVVEDAMRKLDVPPVQVLIEAAITEVGLTGELSYGVDWSFIQGKSSFVSGSGSPIAPAANASGFAYFLRTSDISTTLRALENRTNVKVISAPKILVLNNQTAALQVGDQVPIQTQQQQTTATVGTGNIVSSIEYRDTGVILRVTPRVNASGMVLLDISQEVSDVTSVATGEVNSPTIATRRIATTVAVQDGQVLGLGGLFRDSRKTGSAGLPVLSRIPILGALFGRASNEQKRTELIILIKPQIVRTPDDGRAITEELRAKLRTLEPFKTEGRIP